MTEGIVRLAGPALSAMTVEAIELRMVIGLAAEAIVARVGWAVVRPNVGKLIPGFGWAFTIGLGLYAAYEAYNATAINWPKLEAEIYDGADDAIFRRAFTETRAKFVASEEGRTARENDWKYILIPSEIMPTIAMVDLQGMATYGNVLEWDPPGAADRRAIAMRGRAAAGQFPMPDGTYVRGSWEEYPFAVTKVPGMTGAHVAVVPLRENWIQGGFIRAAAMAQSFERGMTVRCYVV